MSGKINIDGSGWTFLSFSSTPCQTFSCRFQPFWVLLAVHWHPRYYSMPVIKLNYHHTTTTARAARNGSPHAVREWAKQSLMICEHGCCCFEGLSVMCLEPSYSCREVTVLCRSRRWWLPNGAPRQSLKLCECRFHGHIILATGSLRVLTSRPL